MMLIALSLFATVRQEPLDAKISMSVRAESTERFADELSRKTGIRFLCSVQTKDEIIFVHVKDVTLRDLMARIAQATHAEWTKAGVDYRLDRTPEMRQVEQDRVIEVLAKEYAAAIEKRKEQAATQKEFDQGAAFKLGNAYVDLMKEFAETRAYDQMMSSKSETLVEGSPTYRLMARILAKLDPRQLAAVAHRKRVVFSSNPTAMQLPLPTNVSAELAQYVKEQNQWSDTAKPMVAGLSMSISFNGMETTLLPSQMGKVLLIARHDAATHLPSIEMKIANRKGDIVGRGWTRLQSDAAPRPKLPATVPDPYFKMEWSPEAMALQKFQKNAYLGKQGASLPEDLKDKLTRPEEVDPLSFNASDMLLSAAHGLNKNVVAELNDGLVTYLPIVDYPGFRMSTLRAVLDANGTHVEEDGDWIVGSDQDGPDSRLANVDRRALGDFLRTVRRDGRASLDARVAYAVRRDPESRDQLSQSFMSWLNANSREYTDAQDNELRIFSGLSPSHRLAAKGGPVRLALGSMPDRAIRSLIHMVYEENNFLRIMQVDPEVAKTTQPNHTDLDAEPTESLPNGLPRNTVIEFNLREDPVICPVAQPTDERASWITAPQSPQGLAWLFFQGERPDIFAQNQVRLKRSDVDRVRYGVADSWTISGQLTTVLGVAFALGDQVMGPEISFNQIPADFRKAIDDNLTQFRNSYSRPKQGGGQGVKAPPRD